MKPKNLLPLLLALFYIETCYAQQQVIPLWSGVAPGSESWAQKEESFLNDQKQRIVRNVVTPTITVYKPNPAMANGTGVIIAPGGGFRFLSWQTEGTEVAEWLAARGVTAFVLKYRVMNTGPTQKEFQKSLAALFREISNASNPANAGKPEGDIHSQKSMSDAEVLGREDGRQAIRIVRQRATEWGIRTDRIGFIGFSAGGMITLGTALKYDKDCRPDFAGAIYTPWSGETVPSDAPPMFVLVAGDDKLASPGAIQTYSAWKAAGRPAELHTYSKGGHGFGMQKKKLPVDSWIERFWDWMEIGRLSTVQPSEVTYGRKDGMVLTMVVQPPVGQSNGKGIIWLVSAGWTSEYTWINILFKGLVKPISERGYTIFYVMHGSQPKYTVPDAVVDIKRAVQFIRYHAKDYGIDPDHIGISGASAGGHLSLITGTSDDISIPNAKDPVDRVSSRVQAVACFFPPVDLLNWKAPGDNAVIHSDMKEFQAPLDFVEWNAQILHYVPVTDSVKRTKIGRNISPLYFVTADDPPTLIAHGDADKLVPLSQSQMIIEKLREVNVPCELKIKAGAGHGFWKDMTEYTAIFADWFDKYLKM